MCTRELARGKDRNDLAGWLMETGDDIDRPDVGGMTMMMWAAAYGQTPTVQMLINHGASVHTAGKEMGKYYAIFCLLNPLLCQRLHSILLPAVDAMS